MLCFGSIISYNTSVNNWIMKRRKQNHKISFHFFSGSPHTPRRKAENLKGRKFLVLWATAGSEARNIRFTTQSERTIWERITMHAERAKLIKILRILPEIHSNFVQ